MGSNEPPTSLEAKIVILGSQGAGKTSFVHRYVKNTFVPPHRAQSTVGASFLTTRAYDPESETTIRLQIWDTAGQERFRSLSRLYYRGAHAAILCYDVTSQKSFDDMGRWLTELREHGGGLAEQQHEMVVHIVGTKSDVVAAEPTTREVPFERCIEYVAEQLYPESNTPGAKAVPKNAPTSNGTPPAVASAGTVVMPSLSSSQSNRSSGLWGQEQIWDCCHEVSAKDGEGVEEVFRVVTRKLVEQYWRRVEIDIMKEAGSMDGTQRASGGSGPPGQLELSNVTGSFRIGPDDKRRQWVSALAMPGVVSCHGDGNENEVEIGIDKQERRCC